MGNYEIPHNKQADKVVDFCNRLHLVGDYTGQLCKLRPYQEQIFRRLFGTIDEEGLRIIRRCLLMLPRKASKTYMCAQIALYALLTFGNSQSIICAAASQKQAKMVFQSMRDIISQDQYLSSILTVLKGESRIIYEQKNSYFFSTTCGGSASHGHNASLLLVDEYHAIKTEVARETVRALVTGRATRKEPMSIFISTQGDNPFDLCGEEFAMAKKIKGRIVNGTIIEGCKEPCECCIDNPAYLAVLYYLDSDADIHDRKNWYAVQPALGDFVDIKDYEDNYKIGLDIPSRMSHFKQLYLNMPSSNDKQWLDLETVKACYGEIPDLTGATIWCGLDLAPVCDLSCLAIVFEKDGKLYLKVYSWCALDTIRERTVAEKVPYDLWREDGFITATPGNTTDFAVIEDDIKKICKPYKIKKFGADKSYAYDLGQRLVNDGIPVEWFKQGFISFGPAVARMEKLILEKAIVIEKNPVLEYCLSNTKMETDAAENRKPSNKLRARTEKIDAAVASIMAVGLWLESQVTKKKSAWENPRELFLTPLEESKKIDNLPK